MSDRTKSRLFSWLGFVMVECKYYEETEWNWMKILVKKDDSETVILTRRRLLQVCDECLEKENCDIVCELYKLLKF